MIHEDFFDQRRLARSLYWRGWGVTQICEELRGLKRSTVESWKQRDKWDAAPSIARMEDSLEVRFNVLVHKQHKDGGDFKEIDLLGRQLERLARIRRYEGPGGHEGDLNAKVGARNAGEKKKPVKNHFTAEQVAELRRIFEGSLFGHQKAWMLASTAMRTRVILKSRQIGATYYFAREALLDALETGRNQIFLSASKKQAHVFRTYIVQFAALVGVQLVGETIVLSSEALGEDAESPTPELIFLGTNSKTAQSYHGNFYFDEFMWVHGFKELNKVASAMAVHKKWRKTYFSTPSSITHEAYPFWTGADGKKRKGKTREDFDVSHAALKDGALYEDRRWRHIVTLLDAEAAGCDLFDVEEVRDEHSADEFENLYMCGFIDDSMSAFKFNDLQACTVDAYEEWLDDFSPFAKRPYGDRPVWVGVDPSDTGDNAAIVVVAPPLNPKGKFRVLEKYQLLGAEYDEQAAAIEEICGRFNVTYIGIDANGVGSAVLQLVRNFYPSAVPIEYSALQKTIMVAKAVNVIGKGRLQYDAGDTAITTSFLSIRKTITRSGRNVTYEASRTEEAGHADLAWAIMHVLINEPLEGNDNTLKKGFTEIFGHDDVQHQDGERTTHGVQVFSRSGAAGRRLRLRRSGAGARSPRVPGLLPELQQRPLVRAPRVADRAGQGVRGRAAPFELRLSPPQRRPAPLHPVALHVPRYDERDRAGRSCLRQFLPRAA